MNSVTGISEPVLQTLKRVALTKTWRRIYDAASLRPDFCSALMEGLRVRCRISDSDIARIPRTGPVIVVANHPTGLLDGIALGSVLPRIRPDVRFLANSLLENFAPMIPITFFVDPFGGPESAKRNIAAMKAAMTWLKQGGLLVTFPAGEVAHLDVKQGGIIEPQWNSNIGRIAQAVQATVVPAFFTGTNSPLFHVAGMVHPRLRTLLLPHELLNKQNRDIEMRVGSPVTPAKVKAFSTPADLTFYLRRRTLLLANRGESTVKVPQLKAIVEPTPQARVEQDLQALPQQNLLLSSGDYQVWLTTSEQSPSILREIARLREITFRANGEGTGGSSDQDEFDRSYLHLFLWHPESRKIAGAYRLGQTDVILPVKGRKGLYIDTLFKVQESFYRRLGPAIELGRSFVTLEHQKSYAALLSLWKGIGRFLSDNPRYRYLFGPVSISNQYLPLSRQLMVDFLNRNRRAHDLAAMVSPRTPYWSWNPRVKDFDGLASGDAEEISSLLADIEKDQKGVPVLLRQYLKLGGDLLAFNVDRKFSNVLDGLILVDMVNMDQRMLERYMGKERATAFRAIHTKIAAA